jgi:hypothetical protein
MDYSKIHPKKWADVIQYFHEGKVVGVHDRHPPRWVKKLTRREFEQQLEQQIINRNNHEQ